MELTFGQLIDTIKEGETAACLTKDSMMDNMKMVNGTLRWTSSDVTVPIMDTIRQCKWTILPNYLTMDEALTLLSNGTSVRFQDTNGKITTYEPNTVIGRTITELGQGKWLKI